MLAAIVALTASQSFAWTIKARELVDVEIAHGDAVTILVSAPGTESPGLYQWKSGVAAPKKLCSINAPSSFSFNRRIVIERVHGAHDSLRLYDAASCATLGQIETAGRVIDVDAQGALVAIAIQYPDEGRALELYTKRGKRIAKTAIGRNVELGFAPDGKSLFNFDLSDAANARWKLRSLKAIEPPKWMNDGEVTFISGAPYVAQYSDGALAIVPWSTGKSKHAIAAARSVRLRQLSGDGRYGVVHERLTLTDSVAWFDFATDTRVQLGEGSIDHAAINASGTKVAWTQRGGLLSDEVTVMRASVGPAGAIISEN